MGCLRSPMPLVPPATADFARLGAWRPRGVVGALAVSSTVRAYAIQGNTAFFSAASRLCLGIAYVRRWIGILTGHGDIPVQAMKAGAIAVARGRVNNQIAFDLGIREVTVKLHRANVMRKMQAASIGELVRIWESLRCPCGPGPPTVTVSLGLALSPAAGA
jgi:hypothetical protein